MQIIRIEGTEARCAARGVERDVSVFMLRDEDLRVGDYVLIHVGYAIQKIDREDAESSWDLFDQMLAGT
jgi:hydrogenase expression/formation protein HypC